MCNEIKIPQLEKGTKIVCPKCKVLIGEFKRTVRGGEVLMAEDINFFVGNFKNGDYLECPKCGFLFGVEIVTGGVIYTDKGWLPIRIPTKALIPAIEEFLEKLKKKENKA
jgi:DNA-directed RNA polymerase subunit RPC12/RpoP